MEKGMEGMGDQYLHFYHTKYEISLTLRQQVLVNTKYISIIFSYGFWNVISYGQERVEGEEEGKEGSDLTGKGEMRDTLWEEYTVVSDMGERQMKRDEEKKGGKGSNELVICEY